MKQKICYKISLKTSLYLSQFSKSRRFYIAKYTGEFFKIFLMYIIQHFLICRLSDSTVSEDAAIEPRTIATLALPVRRSNHSAIDIIRHG